MRPNIIISTIAAAVVLTLALLLFGAAMQLPVNHDENTYCAAGALISSGYVMYRDFAYLQMPWLPVIYSSLFAVFETTDYLFVGRVFSVVCSVLIMILVMTSFIHAFQKHRITGFFFGCAAAILYAYNFIIRSAGGLAWNHTFPLLCITLSYVLLVRIDFLKPVKASSLFFIGFLNSMAVFTRLSFALAGLVFFLNLTFLIPVSFSSRFKKLILPFVMGGVLPLVLVIYYLFRAPASFIFDTIRYFHVTGDKHWLPGVQPAVNFYKKLNMSFNVLGDPSYLAILGAFLYACVLAITAYRKLGWQKFPLVFSLMLSVSMVVAAFMITPSWEQYFAAPIPFFLIAIAYSISGRLVATDTGSKRILVLSMSKVVLVICVILSVINSSPFVSTLKAAFYPDKWIPSKVYTISRIASQIVGPDRVFLTLAPIFALEGRGKIYQELSTGPFLFRYGRFLSDSQRRIAVSTYPQSLPEVLEKKPPDAVFVGFESVLLEASLVTYAKNSGWKKIRIDAYELYIPAGHEYLR